MPIFNFKVTNNGFTDLTPATGNNGFNKNNADWKVFLDQYETILAWYGYINRYKKHGLGDLKCSLVCNDFLRSLEVGKLDATIGFVLPTGSADKIDQLFSLDYGFKNSWGMQLGLDHTLSLFDYMALESGFNTVFFTDHSDEMRLHTSNRQKNFIKLVKGKVRKDIGTIWNVYTATHLFSEEQKWKWDAFTTVNNGE